MVERRVLIRSRLSHRFFSALVRATQAEVLLCVPFKIVPWYSALVPYSAPIIANHTTVIRLKVILFARMLTDSNNLVSGSLSWGGDLYVVALLFTE